MSYRLIALDIDGTLLNSRKELPEENARAVRAACAAGKTACIIPGKRRPSACAASRGNKWKESWPSPGRRT